MLRDDVSDRLIHLTRGESPDPKKSLGEAFDRFVSIVQAKKLVGGSGYIKGSYRCVCFTEAPIGKLTYILANAAMHGLRYAPYGVMVEKQWLFELGGRPVIYGPDDDFSKLPEEMRYRHVRFWLGDPYTVDHTWEREWRLKTDELILDPSKVTLVVPDRIVKEIVAEHVEPGWHFIVLSDLGVKVEPI